MLNWIHLREMQWLGDNLSLNRRPMKNCHAAWRSSRLPPIHIRIPKSRLIWLLGRVIAVTRDYGKICKRGTRVLRTGTGWWTAIQHECKQETHITRIIETIINIYACCLVCFIFLFNKLNTYYKNSGFYILVGREGEFDHYRLCQICQDAT